MASIQSRIIDLVDDNGGSASSVVSKAKRVSADVKSNVVIANLKREKNHLQKHWNGINGMKTFYEYKITEYEGNVRDLSRIMRTTDSRSVKLELTNTIEDFTKKIKAAKIDLKYTTMELKKAYKKFHITRYNIKKEEFNVDFRRVKKVVMDELKFDTMVSIHYAKRIDLNKLWRRITSEDIIGYIAEFLPYAVRVSFIEQNMNIAKLLTKITHIKRVKLFAKYWNRPYTILCDSINENYSFYSSVHKLNEKIILIFNKLKVTQPRLAQELLILVNILAK